MLSGVLTFATKGKAFRSIGTHQKFDREAYRLMHGFVSPSKFPLRKQILKFEGMGGPDGYKVKSKNSRKSEVDHQWDPINQIGYLPTWIDVHYKSLIQDFKDGDLIKASFDAAHMAHYLTDSLTPSHHISNKLIAAEYKDSGKLKKGWVHFGRKGIMSTHVKFEAGIGTTVSITPIRTKFDKNLYEKILNDGIKKVVREESLLIAKLGLYDQFIEKGWTVDLAKSINAVVVKRIPQLIAAAWLSAYTEAGNKPKINL